MELIELIEKMKKVSTGLGRLGQIAEQNAINEAIALLGKQRVSAEECSHQYSRSMNQEYPRKCLRCGVKEGAKAMHDYAGQSDAVEFAEWVSDNDYYYDSEIDFWDKSTNDNSNSITSQELYQAFLNREEKQK
jgi:hypothetical protein